MSEKKRAILLTSQPYNASRVYDDGVTAGLSERYELYGTLLSKSNLREHAAAAGEAEYIFSTWGMEHFTREEIREYFKKAKCLFYAAGSVQDFAREFLDCKIRVFSAWQANAVPVAEYTYAQILLATKGFYRAARHSRLHYGRMAAYSESCGGNYRAKIGIIGVGCIGSAVAQKLSANDVEVLYYDPFLPPETASALNIRSACLEDIFSQCDVITNHLANKDELSGILDGRLFDKMKPYAVFINTGRGRQVDENGLVRAMRRVKTRTALLDVITHEPLKPFSKIARCGNIIVTPHIAGSNGREVVRMAQFMSEEARRLDENESPLYEVSTGMLATMA